MVACVFCFAFESLYPTTVPDTEKIPNQYCLTGCGLSEYLFRIYWVTDVVLGAVNRAFNQRAVCLYVCLFILTSVGVLVGLLRPGTLAFRFCQA